MNISLHWLNRVLSGTPIDADTADALLTQAGFPIEERETLPTGDVRLDVEVTSNRGDCLSHHGCAREIVACGPLESDRSVELPSFADPDRHGDIHDHLKLSNDTPDACPRFTARVIRGVTVGPSPAWLVEALESIGQRSINNVVDVTNYINFELGNPCHVFDLDTLAGGELRIRFANEGEALTTLDGKERKLKAGDLVVADAERAQSLAGVIGGADSQVTDSTTNVVLEMATWDVVTIRTAARRLAIRTDAGYRFERGVHPATIDLAAERAASMICELAGGMLCHGVLDEGAPEPKLPEIDMRPSRIRELIGMDIPVSTMIARLRGLEIGVDQLDEDTLRCTIPPHRLDLTREADLVEEIARTHGIDEVPIAERIAVRPRGPQPTEGALRAIAGVLVAQGYHETVTFSFVSPAAAEVFMPAGLVSVGVDDDRRKAEPTLRPSVLPSLVACRSTNRSAGVDVPGGVRLFETSAVFAQTPGNETREHPVLALLADAVVTGKKNRHADMQRALRVMRGTIDAAVTAVRGSDTRVRVEPADPPSKGWHTDGCAKVWLIPAGGDEIDLGIMGVLSDEATRDADLDAPVVAAELMLEPLLADYPPRVTIETLPSFPSIERDLSLVVDEATRWAQVESLVRGLDLDRLDGLRYIDTFRGESVGEGKKSLTLRVRFRDPSRTLRHEEVDPQMAKLISAAESELGGTVRG